MAARRDLIRFWNDLTQKVECEWANTDGLKISLAVI